MDDYLGYKRFERSANDDYRNGYKRKQLNSWYGFMKIEVSQDRKSTFELQVVKKIFLILLKRSLPCIPKEGSHVRF